MPKLDDYDDQHATAPVSDSAKSSIVTKLSSGASFAPTTSGNTTPTTPANPTASAFPSSGGFGSTTLGGNTASTFGSPSTSSFGGSSSFGSPSTSSFGGANNQQAQQGGAMQEGGTTTIATNDKFGDFINSKWRPMMAVIYMITCTTDFVIFPVLWSVLQAISHGTVTSQWTPLTLQGAGLYHIAMGAVLGLAAYGRSQEKIAGKA
jgi:hypothetical protein